MRVALDAYPLFGQRTGVGTYVLRLTEALLRLPGAPEVVLPTVSVGDPGPAAAVPGTERHHAKVPFRLVQGLWDRLPFPPAEWLVGSDLDLFHATNFVAPPFRRTPLVTTIHDLSHELFPDSVDHRVQQYRRWVPDTIRRSRTVICHAAAAAEDIIRFYDLPAERVIGIPLGVDPSWFRVEPVSEGWLAAQGLPPRYLVAVGASTARKRIDLLVAAVQRARRADEAVPPLVLVGAAPPAEVTARAVEAGDVVLAGHVDDDALRSIVAAAVALVFPSQYEGFGLPLLEAMAAGTAVVASDLGVHREVCGEHAVLVPLDGSDDVAQLADALVTAARAAPDAAALAAATAWATGFTWERTAAATLAVYEGAIG
jgi:glycosyltransferase involved in cell wall biosynthesis